MGQYKRNSERERKPARRYGSRSEGRSAGRSEGRSERRSEGRSEGRYRRDGDRPRKPLEMHNVVCDKCGKDCEVPFKPTSSKPVYCSDCFKKSDDSSSRPRYEPKGRSNRSEDDLAKINKKLDKIMRALKIE
ncbi:MAG: hypothetical protein KAK00_09255 [Nanoarchaeota archaeon]|nr:hypothetical protein [Nanoarchaeota archaeon]